MPVEQHCASNETFAHRVPRRCASEKGQKKHHQVRPCTRITREKFLSLQMNRNLTFNSASDVKTMNFLPKQSSASHRKWSRRKCICNNVVIFQFVTRQCTKYKAPEILSKQCSDLQVIIILVVLILSRMLPAHNKVNLQKNT